MQRLFRPEVVSATTSATASTSSSTTHDWCGGQGVSQLFET